MGLLAGTGTEHRYQLCDDEYCDRFPCRIYKEGHRDGKAEGFTEGYDEGFPDGVAACPLSHG